MKLVEWFSNDCTNVNIGNKKTPGHPNKIKTGKNLQAQANII
jgi:hypothetical protein